MSSSSPNLYLYGVPSLKNIAINLTQRETAKFNASIKVINNAIDYDSFKKQRELLGKDMFQRARNTIDKLKSIGIDIEQYIIKGRSHNNQSGIGVNEIGDQIIKECFMDTINNYKKL